MTMGEYQAATGETAVYPKEQAVPYLVIGLANETGEVAGKYKKFLRGDYNYYEMREKVKDEAGDVLWYLARLLDELDIPFESCAKCNISKLLIRKKNGMIQGDGDER